LSHFAVDNDQRSCHSSDLIASERQHAAATFTPSTVQLCSAAALSHLAADSVRHFD
jgi:hypothetical protein